MPTPIEQLLSRTVYDTDGTTTVWDFSFASGYLDPSHVKAYTTDSLGAQTPIVVTDPMLIGEFQLEITPALADNLVLTIYRDTPKDAPLVNFTDESGFSEIALDTNAKQSVMVAAEAIDTVNSSDIQGAISAAETAASAAAAAAVSAASVSAAAITAAAEADAAEAAAIAAAASAASINPASYATAAQGTKADSALQLASLSGAPTKATPVDADEFTFLDSAASFILKKLTWANIKTVLSSVFAAKGANSDITSLSGLTTPLSTAQGGTGSTAGVVLLSGDQTVAGVKTFSSQPVLPRALVTGTVVPTTSGNVVNVTGIPSWAKRVTIPLSVVGTSGASQAVLRIGPSGGVETSGYLGATGSAAASSGTPLYDGWSGSARINGVVVLTLLNASTNLWAITGHAGRSDSAGSVSIGVTKALAGTLTQFSLTTTGGTDTFASGSITMYAEG